MDGEEYMKLIQILVNILLKLVVIGDFIQWLYPDAEQQDAAYHFLFAR